MRRQLTIVEELKKEQHNSENQIESILSGESRKNKSKRQLKEIRKENGPGRNCCEEISVYEVRLQVDYNSAKDN